MALRDVSSALLGLLLLLHTWGGWADVQVNMEDKVEVSLGQTAQITCMFTSDDGIGAMIIQWFYVKRSNEKERIYYRDATTSVADRGTPFTDRISMNGSVATGEMVLTIRNVLLEDELEFICLVKSLTDGTAEGRTKLQVFETPNAPTIEAAQNGISVNEDVLSKIGTCEVKNGHPKPNITWYRNSTPVRSVPGELHVKSTVTSESSGLFSVMSELRMKVVKEDKDAQFYCEVTYFVPGATLMTETSRINVTVYYPHDAVNIWVASPAGKVKEGDRLELQCEGNGNTQSSIFTIRHVEDGRSWESDRLELQNVSRLDSGVYECEPFDPEFLADSIVTKNTSVFVHYLDSAVVTPGAMMEVTKGGQLQASCNALSSLQTNTVWFKDGVEVSTGHRLIIDDVSFDTSGLYECVVTVPEIEGMSTSSTLTVKVVGAPEIAEEDTDLETYDKSVQLKCHAIGYPAPEMTWTTSDGKVTKTTQTETESGFESVITVQVSSNITAVCHASNEYGSDLVTFTITAITHTTTTATTTTTTTTTTITPSAVVTEIVIPPKKVKKESNGVIIAVIIICILLLAVVGAVLYFLYKKGKICGRSGKQDLTKGKSSKDNIVVEMKSDNTEEAILLGVNGEKQPPNDQ
ncbi:cell surface glycoprotein MUC18-like isoform X2 [Salarias fasciatus]|nr:cell surface glycoprotein MUC18-like isoform X2 [Salarias fasciatus]